jgi:predicted nucleic acid-binding protein
VALILDTGVLYALIDRGDAAHATCSALIQANREPVVLPSPILVEVDYLLANRGFSRFFLQILEEIRRGALNVADLTPPDYVRVRELRQRYGDFDIGLVDAAVLAVTERLGEPKLATLDRRHFSVLRPRHVDALELLP